VPDSLGDYFNKFRLRGQMTQRRVKREETCAVTQRQPDQKRVVDLVMSVASFKQFLQSLQSPRFAFKKHMIRIVNQFAK